MKTAYNANVKSISNELQLKKAITLVRSFGKPVNGGPKFSYHIRARMPSVADYLYGNSFDV